MPFHSNVPLRLTDWTPTTATMVDRSLAGRIVDPLAFAPYKKGGRMTTRHFLSDVPLPDSLHSMIVAYDMHRPSKKTTSALPLFK